MLNKPYIILTLFLVTVASGCKKNKLNYFPNVAFEEYVYLNNASSAPLQHPGGWIYTEGGYAGLIIYRRYISGGIDDFAVFDRGCPAHHDEDCGTLVVDDDDLYAVCSCEDEKYLLLDGSPAENASYPLIPYTYTRNGDVLYISN